MVTARYNPDDERGAIVSLWTLREAFTSGEPVIFMDGDVPYNRRMMQKLLASPPGSFGVEDVTGLPWVEIDFPEDLVKAE